VSGHQSLRRVQPVKKKSESELDYLLSEIDRMKKELAVMNNKDSIKEMTKEENKPLEDLKNENSLLYERLQNKKMSMELRSLEEQEKRAREIEKDLRMFGG